MFWRVPGFLQSSNQHMSFGQRSMSCVVPIGAARPIPRHEEENSPLHKASPSEDEVPADNKVPMSSRQRTPTTRHDKMAERRVGRRAERRAEGRWSARGGQAGSAQAPAAGMCWRRERAPAGCYTGYDKPHMPPRQKCACVRGAPATVRQDHTQCYYCTSSAYEVKSAEC